jgi:Fic family protein
VKSFKSGKFISQGSYRSFQPNGINQPWTVDDPEVLNLLSQADRELGRLDMFSHYVPNIDLFISMHVLKEATQSSKIEGTQTNIEEALMDRAEVAPEKQSDWEEVQNYVEAMNFAIGKLDNLPFSSRLIRETHKVLLQGVRGEKKTPGEFRISQNWIGGASLKDAVFVPPVHTSVHELMSDLENFVHNETILLPELLKVALLHYQFETIHPFLDGNGRVGRLMITLYLVDKGILKKPVLYLSDFLERNRTHYYDNLMRVREKNDIAHWFRFFLTGVIETAKSSIQTFDAILQLQKKTDQLIQQMGSRASNAQKVMQQLYQHPITNADKVSKAAGISSPTAYSLIEALESKGIVREITGAQRKRMYIFDEYIKLFR